MGRLTALRVPALLGSLGLLLLIPASLRLQAQTTTLPARTVWLGESAGLVVLDGADARVLFEIADGAGVRAVAADELRGRVWAHSPGTLRAYRFDASVAVAVTLPLPSDSTSTTPVHLVVDPDDGSVWLGIGQSLQHVGPQGQLLLTLAFAAPIHVLALDPPRDRIWVGTAVSLEAYDAAGQVVASIPIGGDERLLDAVVDEGTGHVWVALTGALRRVDQTGATLLDVLLSFSSQRWVARDGAGGVWAAIPTALIRVTATGQLAVAEVPWPGPGPILGLAADPTDQSVWVAAPGAVAHVGPTGAMLHQVTLWAGLVIRDLVWARNLGDVLPPVIAFTIPTDGAVLGQAAPTLQVTFTDEGEGVDLATLRFTVNGAPLAVTCAPPRGGGGMLCRPVAPLADGPYTFGATIADRAGNVSAPAAVRVTIDTVAPLVGLTAPASGLVTAQPLQPVSGTVSEPATVIVNVAGQVAATLSVAAAGAFSAGPVTLPEGTTFVEVVALDAAGNRGTGLAQVTVDTTAPLVTLTAPAVGLLTNQPSQIIAGSVSEAASVTLLLNGVAVQNPVLDAANAFASAPVTLVEGANTLEVRAVDGLGNAGGASRTVTLDTAPPAALVAGSFTVGEVTGGTVTVVAAAGSAEPGTRIVVRNLRSGATTTVFVDATGAFTATLPALPGDQVAVTAADAAGNTNAPLSLATRSVPPPPDPATIAPPIDRTVATALVTATAFLYSGVTPIQLGVAPGTIEPRRGAVLRGVVQGRDGAPLSGVRITVLGHPEFGLTLTRADGVFDLAVNGGGLLTVQYEKAGFLPAQRQVQAPWQTYAWLPAVTLVALDPAATAIDLAAPAMQVARGSAVTDAEGTRRATVLFPAGTRGTLVRLDGTTEPITTLSVRATEYTVGPRGPSAMPAELPPTSGYTYAVELSVDEALAANAKAVRFSQPVLHYVENFLDFPVGGSVPVGFYDRDAAAWVPSANGRVVKVLAVTAGLAELDLAGGGVAADVAALAALGVTADERRQLAALYAPGQSLWRVPIPHFSTWDCNWAFGPPAGAEAPAQPLPATERPPDSPTCGLGSIIECESQVLGETIPLAGTPFHLRYQSDRTAGRLTANRLRTTLTDSTPPPALKRVEVEVEVAGRRETRSVASAPNLADVFAWDGVDAYGRKVQGAQPVRLRVGYVYDGVYREPGQLQASFGAPGGAPITGNRARQEATIWQELGGSVETALGGWDARPQGLGGWTLNVHHAYDPTAKVLYEGGGTRRSPDTVKDAITTVAGTGGGPGGGGLGGDGGPAALAPLSFPSGVAVAADGSLYIADSGNGRVRRVSPDGVMTTVAGGGTPPDGVGDGGPATQARLAFPADVAVGPDGSLYVPDNGRIRRVSPDGLITTVAGTGVAGFAGDGGPATQAQLFLPGGIAVAGDGSLYVADRENRRVRRIGTDGVITTVAGTGLSGSAGDGGPARQASLDRPVDVALGPDGTLYVAEDNAGRIRRIGPDGIVTTVAGPSGSTGDGVPATDAVVFLPQGVAVAPDGTLYLAETIFGHRIRRVTTDGVITTVAGGSSGSADGSFSGDGGPAASARLSFPAGLAFGPDGTLYLADSRNHRVRAVGLALPRFTGAEFVIAGEDGGELHAFDAQGRHLRTVDALTNAVRHAFTYDSAGRLTAVTDRAGLVTTIERDPAGAPTAVVAPAGQRTTLSLDATGHLTAVTNPAGEATRITVSPDGLLEALTDPKGHVTSFAHDGLGRLSRDADPAGGGPALTRTDRVSGYSTTRTTALGRTSRYDVDKLPSRETRRVTVEPSGEQTITVLGSDGSQTVTAPDGTVTRTTLGPDPRFGMQVPVVTEQTVTTPSGLTRVVTATRTASLSATPGDPLAPLGLVTQTDMISVNGRTTTSTFDAASRTTTHRSPAGRQVISRLDTLGRVVEVQPGDLEPTRYIYDMRGRLATVSQGVGLGARIRSFAYDVLDRLVSATDPLGRTTSYAYDSADRLTTQTFPDGRQIGYAYDAAGNRTVVTPPGRLGHGFTYTSVNLAASYMPPAVPGVLSPSTMFTYDLDRQLTLVTRPDGQTLAFQYDGGGRLSTLTVPTGVFRYGYAPATGQLVSLTAPDGGTLTATYDGSLATGETWGGPPGAASGRVSWTYDADFRTVSESVNGVDPIAFAYDPDGLLIQAGVLVLMRDPQNGFVTASTLGVVTDGRAHSTFGELSRYRAEAGGALAFEVAYVRDALGRIVEKIETVEGVMTATSYAYDLAGRLVETRKDGVVATSFTYDANGNRIARTTPAGTETGTYDEQDRLMSYGDMTYTYTANGEMATKTDATGTATYQYDVVGNLVAVLLPGGTKIEYIIDSRSRRVGKRVNGVTVRGWLYRDQLKPVAELSGQGNVVARFVYGASPHVPDYVIKGGATYRVIADHIGSPRLVVDAMTGVVVQRLDYDEFGQVTLDTNPGFQPFGFAGGLYDQDTGLTRFGARDYDARTGRWTAKDPIRFKGRDSNLYAYALGDPLNTIDPWGLLTVYYWRPRYAEGVVGHTSIELDDGTYISVWPSGNPIRSPAEIHTDFYQDLDAEDQVGPRSFTVTGLDEQKIKQWWRTQLGPGYRLASRNCSTVVAEALKVGGLPLNLNPSRTVTPQDVAVQLQRALREQQQRRLGNATR